MTFGPKKISAVRCGAVRIAKIKLCCGAVRCGLEAMRCGAVRIAKKWDRAHLYRVSQKKLQHLVWLKKYLKVDQLI
jgi:hypothetical protein